MCDFRAMKQITPAHARKNLRRIFVAKNSRLSSERSCGRPSDPTAQHRENTWEAFASVRVGQLTYAALLALNDNTLNVYELESYQHRLAQFGYSLGGPHKGGPPSDAPPTTNTQETMTLTGSRKPFQGLQHEQLKHTRQGICHIIHSPRMLYLEFKGAKRKTHWPRRPTSFALFNSQHSARLSQCNSNSLCSK